MSWLTRHTANGWLYVARVGSHWLIALSMVETKMEPGPDLIDGMVRYMDVVLGLCAVCTGTEEEQVNEYSERVALSYPPPN